MSDFNSPQTAGEPQPNAPAPEIPVASSTPAQVPPRKTSRSGWFFFGALSGCLLLVAGFVFLAILLAAAGNESADISLGGDKVAVIPIEGEIVESRPTLDALAKYAKSNSVRAIVIRINSPGGSVAPSQEIYAAIRRTRSESGKPIVASLDSVAASGGFYIAAACDRIVANPGSITGSIGVILQWFDMKELVQWAKLKPETITSGALKDAGSPFRELTAEERLYFQNVVTQLHGQFVRDVARGREGRMTQEEVARLADGRIFTGEEALRLKLIDELGSIDDAVRTAGRLAGIKGEPEKLWPRRREDRLLELLAGGEADALLQRVISRRMPQFLYRW